MLNKQPEIGQLIKGTRDEFWEDGDPIVLKDNVYVIVGGHDNSGNPYYLSHGEKIYIDSDAWDWYELVEKSDKLNISHFIDVTV